METAMTTRPAFEIPESHVSSYFLSTPRRQIVKHKLWFFSLALVVLPVAWSQSGKEAASSPAAPSEIVFQGYRVHQSVELGYRAGDITGNENMFDTLVNEHDGPRLFDQTLTMQSAAHQGPFDNLFLNSTGWGGEPNNYLRLRVEKSRLYDFRASFRRDQNFFDYNLLANPLNPSTSVPNVPIDDSAHAFQTRRRMSDFDLTLLPKAVVSFRLGFSHNNMTGPSWTSVHEGTDALLLQPWNTTVNAYRFGVDLKPLPRTVVSYNQFLSYYKGDTSQQLNSTPYSLSNGTAVDLGLDFNTASSQPCAAPLSGGFVNPTCSAYFSYSRLDRTRTSLPTEQASIRSNYFRRLDLTGSVSYNSGELKMPAYSELFNGLGRSNLRESTTDGSMLVHRVAATADFSAVFNITDRFRIVDRFRFNNFRLPGALSTTNNDLFGANLLATPNVFGSATCPAPYTAATCPQHASGSPADITTEAHASFFKQDEKTNTFQLQYDFAHQLAARLGYRYDRRTIDIASSDLQDLTFYPTLPNRGACAGLPLVNGVCTTTATASSGSVFEIQEHSLLAGASLRPTRSVRANFDAEQSYADYSLTRVSPRKQSRIRANGTYTPRPWAILGASANLLSNSNDAAAVNYRGHSNNYGFNADLNPRPRAGVDLAYNYSDFQQNAIICFNDTPPAGVTLPVVTNAGSCAANDPNNPLLTNGFYQSKTHYGITAVVLKPAPRVTTRIGYSITSVGGSTPQFNTLQPQGPLAYNYQQPVADVDVGIAHDIDWHLGWNYYQYGEKDVVGPTSPRYFHANDVTVALKYAF